MNKLIQFYRYLFRFLFLFSVILLSLSHIVAMSELCSFSHILWLGGVRAFCQCHIICFIFAKLNITCNLSKMFSVRDRYDIQYI